MEKEDGKEMRDRIKLKFSVRKDGVEAGAEAEAECRSLTPLLLLVGFAIIMIIWGFS